MAKYTGQISKSVTSTTVGVGSLEATGTTTRRMKFLEFCVGSDAASLGTSNFRIEFQRSTTVATGTGVTPKALDPAEASWENNNSTIKSNLSANGTLTSGAIMMTIPMSQQSTVRYVANPGSEIVLPATINNGMHFMTPVCGNNPSIAAQITYEEI